MKSKYYIISWDKVVEVVQWHDGSHSFFGWESLSETKPIEGTIGYWRIKKQKINL